MLFIEGVPIMKKFSVKGYMQSVIYEMYNGFKLLCPKG